MEDTGNRWVETRNVCPACESPDFRTLHSSPLDSGPLREYLIDAYSSAPGGVEFEYLDGASYILCECARCGLIFQRDIPNDFLMERLYEHWIDPVATRERHRTEDDLSYYAEHAQDVMQIIAFLDRIPSSLSILDFGMGWGEWAYMAKAFGCVVSGAELSSERREHSRSNGIPIVDWDEIPERQFDLINADQVFEHIAEPLATLRHLKTGLATGGLLKISVPRPQEIERRLKTMDWGAAKDSNDSLNAVAPLEHINCFRRRSLEAMADRAGMELVSIPVAVQYRNLTDWTGIGKTAKQLIRPIYRSWLKRGNVIILRDQVAST